MFDYVSASRDYPFINLKSSKPHLPNLGVVLKDCDICDQDCNCLIDLYSTVADHFSCTNQGSLCKKTYKKNYLKKALPSLGTKTGTEVKDKNGFFGVQDFMAVLAGAL